MAYFCFVKNIILEQLKDSFYHADTFSRQDLLDFYQRYDPGINEGTFGWKIYELKRKHIIENVGTGVYRLIKKGPFKPTITPLMKQTMNIIQALESKYSIWDTVWLNEFIELQSFNSIIILETEKSAMESWFYQLKDRKKNVYIKPDEATVERYVSESTETIIIKPIISRSPTVKSNKITVPTLEKILVDLFCDDKIFFAYQGRQLARIFENSFEKYSINLSRMMNYGKRRKREEPLKEFLLKTIPDNLKTLLE